MKGFYSATEAVTTAPVPSIVRPEPMGDPSYSSARIAVYDSPAAAPRVEEVASGEASDYIERLSRRIYQLAREAGGEVPYTVVREIAENLIHADFREPVISILDGGATVRISDQGPGIADKNRALEPGFTTAHGEIKRHIRGVGSGLPLVREFLSHSGGSLSIEDNLTGGAVVTLSLSPADSLSAPVPTEEILTADLLRTHPEASPDASRGLDLSGQLSVEERPVRSRLSARQKKVLALVAEASSAGPSQIAKELGVGVSTAYRDLSYLEELGLLVQADAGKREVTTEGIECLSDLMRHS